MVLSPEPHLTLPQVSEAGAWVGGVWYLAKDDWPPGRGLVCVWALQSGTVLCIDCATERHYY